MTVSTPCNLVCQLDHATGWCFGCGRTAAEIAAWGTLTEAERRRIMAALPPRLAALGMPAGGDKEEGERRAKAQRMG
jgi:uncharacterized protein